MAVGATAFTSGADGRNKVGSGRAVAASAGAGVNVSVGGGGVGVSVKVTVGLASIAGATLGTGVFKAGSVTANARGVLVANA